MRTLAGVVEPEVDEYLAIKEAMTFPKVVEDAVGSREAAGKIPVHRHPLNNYRLFRIRDLESLLKSIEPTHELRGQLRSL